MGFMLQGEAFLQEPGPGSALGTVPRSTPSHSRVQLAGCVGRTPFP